MAFLPTPVPMPVRPVATPLAGGAAVPGSVPNGVPGQDATDAVGTGFATLLATISPETGPDIRAPQTAGVGGETTPGLEVAAPVLMTMAAPVLLAIAIPAMSPPDASPPSPPADNARQMSADSEAALAVTTGMENPAFAVTVAPPPIGAVDAGANAAPPAPAPAVTMESPNSSGVTPIPPSGAPASDPAAEAGVRSLRGTIIEVPAGPGLPDPVTAQMASAAAQPVPIPAIPDTASLSPLPGPLDARPATDPSTGRGQAAAAAVEAKADATGLMDPGQSAADATPQATSAAASAATVLASLLPETPVSPATLAAPDSTPAQANDTRGGAALPPSLRLEQPAATIETATTRPGAHETAAAPAARSDNGFGQTGHGTSPAAPAAAGTGPAAQHGAPSFAEQLAAMRTETGLPPQSAPGSEARTAAIASDVSLGGSDPLAGMKSLVVPNAPPGGSTHGAGTTPQPSMPHTQPTPPAVPVSLGIARALADGKSRITVRLDPPELGRVEVRLDFVGDGTVRAMIRADSHHALELLQRDARHLERALTDSGLRADSGSLSFSLNQNGQQGTGLSGGPFGDRHGHGQASGDASPEPGAPVPDALAEPEPLLNYHGTASTGVNLVI